MDPLDELYDALAEVLGPEDANECYKNYLLVLMSNKDSLFICC